MPHGMHCHSPPECPRYGTSPEASSSTRAMGSSLTPSPSSSALTPTPSTRQCPPQGASKDSASTPAKTLAASPEANLTRAQPAQLLTASLGEDTETNASPHRSDNGQMVSKMSEAVTLTSSPQSQTSRKSMAVSTCAAEPRVGLAALPPGGRGLGSRAPSLLPRPPLGRRPVRCALGIVSSRP